MQKQKPFSERHTDFVWITIPCCFQRQTAFQPHSLLGDKPETKVCHQCRKRCAGMVVKGEELTSLCPLYPAQPPELNSTAGQGLQVLEPGGAACSHTGILRPRREHTSGNRKQDGWIQNKDVTLFHKKNRNSGSTPSMSATCCLCSSCLKHRHCGPLV